MQSKRGKGDALLVSLPEIGGMNSLPAGVVGAGATCSGAIDMLDKVDIVTRSLDIMA